jgi:hypothetical protein
LLHVTVLSNKCRERKDHDRVKGREEVGRKMKFGAKLTDCRERQTGGKKELGGKEQVEYCRPNPGHTRPRHWSNTSDVARNCRNIVLQTCC